jgi:lysophospholipase L1-like esterase
MELKNKTVLFLGSSVTYGSAAGGISFVEILGERCGINYIKEAVSGTTLVDIDERSYMSRLKALGTDPKPDLFVCQLSTNDAKRKLDISEIEKAISFILDYAKKTFSCPTVFYTNTYYENEEYSKMVDLLYSLKERYDFYILDLYHDEDMLNVSEEDRARYMKDKVHPTLLGYAEWWTPKFIEFFKALSLSEK